MLLACGNRQLDLSRPKIMGVLNVTPDSFSDGGRYHRSAKVDVSLVLQSAEAMVAAGAAILDVGGESTRPGAKAVGLQEELDRVVPVLEALSARLDVVVSVDTSRPEVMRAGLGVGVGLLNDVRALKLDGALAVAAESDAAVCLMHMQGNPNTMQHNPQYDDVLSEVDAFFTEELERSTSAGIHKSRIVLDPGIGFGKRDEHNLALLRQLSRFESHGCPLLVGLSRKSMVGRLLGRELPERLPGSLGFGLVALQCGAKILRVHDVKETHDIMRVFELTSGVEGS